MKTKNNFCVTAASLSVFLWGLQLKNTATATFVKHLTLEGDQLDAIDPGAGLFYCICDVKENTTTVYYDQSQSGPGILLPLIFIGESKLKYGECQGDCDANSDCDVSYAIVSSISIFSREGAILTCQTFDDTFHSGDLIASNVLARMLSPDA